MVSSQEGQDYVVCRVCGHKGAKLYRHVKKHGLSTKEYTAKYPGAPVRCRANIDKQEATRIAKVAVSPKTWRETKVVPCPSCGTDHDVGKQMGRSHDLRCVPCKQKEIEEGREAQWEGLSEPEDYVTCRECDYRAENLTSHIKNSHPGYRDRHPNAPVVALGSAVRDKAALRGRKLSEDTRRLMSENAGRWNKGLTKETHPSLASASEKMREKIPWSRGLTAAEDPRLAETARKLRMYTGENRPWDNGLAANLTLADFKPFMDSEGRIDHHKVIEATGVSWVTVRKYIVDLGLAQSRRYIEQRAEAQIIRLDKEDFERFKLGNGKVSIAKAMRGLGHAFSVIKRECGRHRLPTAHRRITQTLCLDAVSEALGGLLYQEEWKSRRFLNPPTGRRFRFDGYFPDVGLVVEFQGHQHYTFPNGFMPDESYLPEYEALRERDRVKRELIEAAPDLTFFEVFDYEPYDNPDYLRGRLVELGITPKISPDLASAKEMGPLTGI